MKILDEIRGRLEAASPGPWRWDEEFGAAGDKDLALTNDAGTEIVGAYNDHCCSFRINPTVEDNDAEFIAHAPTDMARLLAAVEAVESLAAGWTARGEHDMAFSKTLPDEHIAMHLLTGGASMVENARHIRNALTAALEGKA